MKVQRLQAWICTLVLAVCGLVKSGRGSGSRLEQSVHADRSFHGKNV